METTPAVVLSVVSAACYALGAVLQERVAHRGAAGLFTGLTGWAALALNGLGALVHVAALRYGPLTVVQPLGALTVALGVPVGATFAGRRADAKEWRGVLLTLIGLMCLLLVTTPGAPARPRTLDAQETCLLATVCGAVILALTVARTPSRACGLRYAIAAGIAFALGSALTQSASVAVTEHGVRDAVDTLLGGGGSVLAAVLIPPVALLGLWLSQIAYRSGLGVPLVVITLANPVVSSLIGISMLGEGIGGGPAGLLCALAGGSMAVCGVRLLSPAGEPQRL
ncbi:hypothetical protein [Streptomyces kanamyceticus]|uniref:Integral membrane protein n=1 Tax=Streptomyces kanamyceticus TaxID=1967 RepID=A0A5J6GRW3_STRKN|nr:hypothetical protein [Streptomyces kanamyceticus]QEU95736.1 hypothetical protein CP970_36675 [Streptomyces kanamyceticus]